MPTVHFPRRLPKVFNLSTPQHWLGKLHWEIKSFKRTESRNDGIFSELIAAYQATNCAITAWHMVDWIWEYCSPEEQKDLALKFKLKNPTVECFGNYLKSTSITLRVCREIATASKHHRITRGVPDPMIDTHYGFTLQRTGKPGAVRRVGRLMVMDDQQLRLARDLFDDAFEYWDHFLRNHGFKEDRFISADPRRAPRRKIRLLK